MSNIEDMRTEIRVTNEDFLKVVFAEEWELAHVTAFADDPEDIPKARRAICWGGGWAKDRLASFQPGENQYFTISVFDAENGKAVRRKANFDACYVLVADDVGEKLPLDRVERLPIPTYKLFTSSGSEQWGWVLETPVEDRAMMENLLDGLVEQGLAPDGRDPGMRGVTRYVRLPEGSNTKGKRCDEQGNPFKCYLSEWNPDLLYPVEDLADVFEIDLFRKRDGGEVMVGESVGSDLVVNHPLMKHLAVTGYGADGWIRIDCPNAAAHSSEDASGAAVQFQADGRVHFQCHHGGCNGDSGTEKMTGERIIKLIDKQLGESVDLGGEILDYKKALDLAGTKALVEAGVVGEVPTPLTDDGYVDSGQLDPNDWGFIPKTNRYYQFSRGVDMCKDALNTLYLHQFPGGRGRFKAADQLVMAHEGNLPILAGFTWMPSPFGEPIHYMVEHEGKLMANEWRGFNLTPAEGDVTPWLDLLAYLVPDEEDRALVIGWLAFMLQKPHMKCQWHIVMRGEKGVGKDSLLAPIMRILGSSGNDIAAEDLEGGWGDHFAKRKLVAMQEIYRPQNKAFTNTLKTLTASTGTCVHTYNLKGGQIIQQPDVMALFAFSNHRYCMALEEGERRYFVLDCFIPRKPVSYYRDYYAWVEDGGAAALFDYLLNVDISEFCYSSLPKETDGMLDLVKGGRADYEETLVDMIEGKEGVFSLPMFEFRHLKTELKDRGHTPGHKGLIEVLESHGWYKFRGNRKVGGTTQNTPTFWTQQLDKDCRAKDVFEFWLANS